MTSLETALVTTAQAARLESLDRFAKYIPAAWVEEALAASGKASVRRRRLPAEQVVWLVLGMAMLRDRSIEEVVDQLDLALPGAKGVPVKSGIAMARKRVGSAPLRWLFEKTGATWGHRSADRDRWCGLAVYGIDGSSLDLADSKLNREHFAGWVGGGGESSHPKVRLVTLMALRSHILVAAELGPYAGTSEMAFARPLRSAIPARSLTIVDRGFLGAAFLLSLADDGHDRHWLTRAKSNTKMRVIQSLGEGDDLVEMTVSDEARAEDETLPKTWRARAIRYQRKGHKPQVLLTSMTDPERFPREEVIAMYHERWELELAYDELKTELLEREETIRSRSPEAVEQELWGILITFNLVRREMERVADLARVAPTRISFLTSLHLVRNEWQWSSISRSPGAIPKHLVQLEERLIRFVLPPRRTARAFPRTVKKNFGRYPKRKDSPPKQDSKASDPPK